ncbi:hypothetical protein DCC85_03645 [Paenibacillus sp. CAA11]|uniref:hypothetical protein n=1 Tax=Paenibacillus sp. CAA11 TaxID=1532905 RepID=UPI000D3DA61C|nr:hypothetical protein [Paenibacillus sp. CAA11]AWB43403.1 hypothetical protein DCC85_03645 [Paenibacillus sp. CAA11]
MSKFKSELTRKMLLNSNSRGSLEEVADEDTAIEFGADEEFMGERPVNLLENEHFLGQWEGKEETHAFFRHSYE